MGQNEWRYADVINNVRFGCLALREQDLAETRTSDVVSKTRPSPHAYLAAKRCQQRFETGVKFISG
jgi:hypothetical protein